MHWHVIYNIFRQNATVQGSLYTAVFESEAQEALSTGAF